MLMGKVTDKTESFGHGKSPLFGKGRHRSKVEWQSLIRQIAASGLLALDAGGYGGLVLTERGRALLNGVGEFRYRREAVRITKKSQRAEAMAAASADPQTDALLTHLKDLRRKLAAARGVPAFVVFSDRSLIDMAKRMPLTRYDFGEVHGVGEAKLKEFGDIFLKEIAASLADSAHS